MGASMYLQEPNKEIEFETGISHKYKTRFAAAGC